MYIGGLDEIMPLSRERLFRDGWTRLQKGVWPPDRKVLKLLEPEIFQKHHPDGKHVLLMKYLGYDRKRYGSLWTYEFSLKDSA